MEKIAQESTDSGTFSFYHNEITGTIYMSFRWRYGDQNLNTNFLEKLLNTDGSPVTYQQWLEHYSKRD